MGEKFDLHRDRIYIQKASKQTFCVCVLMRMPQRSQKSPVAEPRVRARRPFSPSSLPFFFVSLSVEPRNRRTRTYDVWLRLRYGIVGWLFSFWGRWTERRERSARGFDDKSRRLEIVRNRPEVALCTQERSLNSCFVCLSSAILDRTRLSLN